MIGFLRSWLRKNKHKHLNIFSVHKEYFRTSFNLWYTHKKSLQPSAPLNDNYLVALLIAVWFKTSVNSTKTLKWELGNYIHIYTCMYIILRTFYRKSATVWQLIQSSERQTMWHLCIHIFSSASMIICYESVLMNEQLTSFFLTFSFIFWLKFLQ